MKEMTRTNFRPRTIDTAKPLPIIRDVNDLYKKEDNAALNWVKESTNDGKCDGKTVLELETKRIFELFDKKKTIIIPKAEKFEKTTLSISNGEGKFSTHTVAYKQSEFIRPKHYIVYTEKNRLEPRGKDYEATVVDLNFLTSEKFFISTEELEKIISALENDVNKGETIPLERAKEIVVNIIPDKKQHVDKICKYWYIRREEYKKSLARKFWKDQKYTDKYLATTFLRREREKMKTRRNKRNELEGIQKLKEIKETTQKYLANIIQNMKEREITKKNLIMLQQIEFEGKMGLLKSAEEKMKEFLKTYTKPLKTIQLSSPTKKDEEYYETDYKENLPKKESQQLRKSEVPSLTNVTDKSENVINGEIKHKTSKPISRDRRKTDKEQNAAVSTQPTTTNLKPITIKDKIQTSEDYTLKHRIRIDRTNRLIIDRYIQTPFSFSPFDDDFNNIVNRFKIYKEDFVYSNEKKITFDNLYEDYLKGKLGGLIPTDSEDDLSSFNQQFKTFSSSFKQFLKHKRSHNEMMMN